MGNEEFTGGKDSLDMRTVGRYELTVEERITCPMSVLSLVLGLEATALIPLRGIYIQW